MVVYKVSETGIWSKLYSGYYPVYEIISNNSFNLIHYYNWLGVGTIGSNIWTNVTKYDKPVENGCVGPHCILIKTNATLYSVYKNYFYAQIYADRIQHGEVISRVNHGLQKSSDGLNWAEIGIITKLIDFKDDTIFAITDSGLCKTDINGNGTELLNKSDVFNNEVFFLKVFAENENINGINCIVITKMGLFVSKNYGRSFYTSNIDVSLFKYVYNYGYYFNRPHYSVNKNSLFAISDSLLYKLKLNDILSTDTLITDVNNIQYTDIKIYPNPTNGIVFIETPDGYNPYSSELYNSYGILIEKLTNKNFVNLENSPAGLYFIKLITPNRKIIVQKIFKK
jgi:hypothetical protein